MKNSRLYNRLCKINLLTSNVTLGNSNKVEMWH